MNAWSLLVTAGLLVASLGSRPLRDLPRITRTQDIAPQLGNRVTVIGVYRQLNVNQNQQEPPRYRGHVYLELSDGSAVAIGRPSDPTRGRAADEIALLEGKRVAATGTLLKSGGGPNAQLVMPYLTKLEALGPETRNAP